MALRVTSYKLRGDRESLGYRAILKLKFDFILSKNPQSQIPNRRNPKSTIQNLSVSHSRHIIIIHRLQRQLVFGFFLAEDFKQIPAGLGIGLLLELIIQV